jgi:predicted metal-dependent peptidase
MKGYDDPVHAGHRGTGAVQTMVEYAPSTGGLALWMQHQDVDELPESVRAANDGQTIYYGPGFGDLPLPRQVGLVAHQVLHVALRHAQRREELRRLVGDVDAQLYNICADAIVNTSLSHLDWLELPRDAVTLERLLRESLGIRYGPEQALLEWDVERLYRQVDDRRKDGDSGQGQRGDQGASGGEGGEDARDSAQAQARPRQDGPRAEQARRLDGAESRDLLPSDEDVSRPEAAAEQSREWAERISRAHAGDGAFSMLRSLLADLPRVRVPWEQVLRTQLTRGLTRHPELSWSRPSRSYLANQGRTAGGRRMPWEPGMVGSRAVPRLVLVVDVSGSIDEGLLGRFATEIEAITRRTDANLILVIGDLAVRSVQRFEPGVSSLRDLVFEGGAGTDFTPLLKEADRQRPDMGVVLTDLQGPARYRPDWPVLWVVPPEHESTPAPFGRKLVLVD